MRKGHFIALAFLAFFSCSSSASAQNCSRLYLAGSLGAEFLEMQGSGVNTAGGFSNYGRERETNEWFGFALGRESNLGDYQLRLETEARSLYDSHFTLPSFPGPPGPSTFFYRGVMTDRWTAMTNLWIDRPISDNFEVYAGGGIGVSGFKFQQTDNVVSSEKRDEDLAFQFGFGLTCKLLSNVEVDFGYRRVDLGNANTSLFSGTLPAGNLNADLDSDQLALTFRIFQR